MDRSYLILKMIKHFLEVLLLGNQAILLGLDLLGIVRVIINLILVLLLFVELQVLSQELVVSIVVDLTHHQNLVDVGTARQPLDFLPLFFYNFDFNFEEES